jgi:hypothetical protein
MDSRIEYVFAGTPFTADNSIKVTWYDGESRPSAEVRALLEGDELPNTGSIFVGTQGTMVLPHINRPLLYPDKKFKYFRYPEVESGDHWGEFVQACLGHARTSAGFSYAGPLTEAVLLGGVASRFPKTRLHWFSNKLEFDSAEANRFIGRQYRHGWGAKGLNWSA